MKPDEPEPNSFLEATSLALEAEARRLMEEQAREEAREQAERLGLIGEPPIRGAKDAFSKWLRMQTSRHDRIGALAKVAVRDPTWPQAGFITRKSLLDHFAGIGARQFVLDTADATWTEFERAQRRERTKAKRQQEKRARKQNRKAKSRRR